MESEPTPPLQGGIHRRLLPAPAIAFASDEGRQLFREALVEGTAEIFYPLMEQYHTQAEPAFCGLATLVMVLNALSVDPGSMWKGPWRWYHEEALSCCKPTEEIAKDGIEWDEWLCLARCQGLHVDAVRADEEHASLETFEQKLAANAACPGGQAFVVSYSRKPVGQSGDGHYSPIGAYHRGRRLALVLDTARFKYPPHWLPVATLWEALLFQNKATGRSRGYALITRADICGMGLFALKATMPHWRSLLEWAKQELPAVITKHRPKSPDVEVWTLARSLPATVVSLVSETSAMAGTSPRSLKEHDTVLAALRRTETYKALNRACQAWPNLQLPASMESLTLLTILLGRTGLLDGALPLSEEIGLWKVQRSEEAETACNLEEQVEKKVAQVTELLRKAAGWQWLRP